MKDVAAYVRVSTNDQTTGLQRDAIGRYVAGNDLVAWYEDQASGAARSRPMLDRLMADVRAGRVAQVVVYKFDRFARSTQHLLEALEEFRKRGVTFTSLTEGIDTSTAIGRMVYTFLAAIAEFERELIRERVQAGVAAAKRRGTKFGRPKAIVNDVVLGLLHAKGASVADMARRLGVSRSTIRNRLGLQGGENSPPRSETSTT